MIKNLEFFRLSPTSDFYIPYFETGLKAGRRLHRAEDGFEQRIGEKPLMPVSSACSDRTWRLKQEHLSKCYTTRWEDLLEI
jgi:hypothetical protein